MIYKSYAIRSKSFTILEVLLALTISTMIFAALAPYFLSIGKSWSAGSSQNEMLQHGRIAMDTIERSLREAGTIRITASRQSNYIMLTDRRIRYTVIFFHNIPGSPYYMGASGDITDYDMVERYIDIVNQETNDILLAQSVNDFLFEVPVNTTDIIMTMELKDPENLLQRNIVLRSGVYPRYAVLRVSKPVKNLTKDELYDSIQEGIESADSGDTIAVARDVYYENVIMKSGVDIEGYYDESDWTRHEYDSAYETTIDASNGGRAITCRDVDSSSSIDGVVLINGYSDGTGDSDGGGGIYCEDSDLTINHVIVSDCYGHDKGGGIYLNSSDAVITNCTIENNNAGTSSYGGGIAIYNGSAPILADCTIQNNIAEFGGGGIAISDSSSPMIEDCIIRSNTATDRDAGNGGGILCKNSELSVKKTSIISNNAEMAGGGLYIDSCSVVDLENCLITENNADRENGGGIYSVDSPNRFTNCTISDNSSRAGGGLYIDNHTSINSNNLIVSGNSGNYGIYVVDVTGGVTVTYSDFTDNRHDEAKYGRDRGDYRDFDDWGWIGTGCINSDPRFVDANNGDYHLRNNSPCRNMGDPALSDPDNSRSDMGAYGGPGGSW